MVPMTPAGEGADLLVTGAKLVATCDAERRELPGRLGRHHRRAGRAGWAPPAEPAARRGTTLDATGCLVTPGLVNTHHHIYQNLTRAYRARPPAARCSSG